MSAPRRAEPLTEEEEREWRDMAEARGIIPLGYAMRLFATLDAFRAKLKEAKRERDEAREAERQMREVAHARGDERDALRAECAELTAERDALLPARMWAEEQVAAVRAAAIEECAKACDEMFGINYPEHRISERCAAAIRALAEKGGQCPGTGV
jgi:uncharacterized coiled-coil DUF342 family protein